MAQGLDELIDFLLDEVALRTADGLSITEFKRLVTDFFKDVKREQESGSQNLDDGLVHVVDRSLLETTWSWLLQHSDIWVGKPSTDNNGEHEILVSADQDASALSLTQAEQQNSTIDDQKKIIRVWTSHERVWQTVAGHGVDFKRIPGEEFRLLCIIAGARERGVVQPDLVKWSRQDKKSVPGRTDNLHKAGYIRKTRILAEKHNTSLLTHSRFVPKEELDVLSRPVFVNGSLSFDNLLNVLKVKLHNGASMKMEDLEDFVGCASRSWEKRALWRALERLDIIGVVQRFRMDENKPGRNGKVRSLKTRALKMLREPTEEDFGRYATLTAKDREDFRKRLEAQDAEAKGEHAQYAEEEDVMPVAPASPAVADETPYPEAIISHKMQWDPDLVWTNTMYNAVHATGAQGLSSMAAREATYGRFYDRPVEQMLSRLTDVWQNAQPAHLSHFSIIRDTDTKGRSTNYLYRSYEAFQQAVDDGNTVWENATNGKDYEKPVPQLDQFGFPVIDQSSLLRSGNATLADAIADVKHQAEKPQKGDAIFGQNADGTLCILWTEAQNKKPRKSKDEKAATPRRPKSAGGRKKQTAPTFKPKTDDEMRVIAEHQAYNEAASAQKGNPVTMYTGQEIVSSWKSGSGRAKLILVDEKLSSENVEVPQSTAPNKRPPIIVLESRVLEILEGLRATNQAGIAVASTPIPATPKLKPKSIDPSVQQPTPRLAVQRTVSLRSPRLRELPWFTNYKTIEISKNVENIAKSNEAQEQRLDSVLGHSPAQIQQADVAVEQLPSTSRDQTAKVDLRKDWHGQSEDATEIAAPPIDVEDSAEVETPVRRDWAQRQSNYIRPPPLHGSHRKKRGTLVGRGTAQYKRILLVEQIMEKSGGIFPGDSEMVPAFQRLQKLELKSDTTSDRDTIMRAVKALVDDGKLNRFAFYFNDRSGKRVQKFILHQPQIEAKSPEVRALMKKIEEAHPRNYVPPPYGDGETGRAEQRKNIDRFQYRPGKSIVKPSGTEFVIDIEAKRREMEAKREAAAAAVRAEEKKRLKEQAARNRKRQANLAQRPRHNRFILAKPAQEQDLSTTNNVEEDTHPDHIMPSIEMDSEPITRRAPKPRYKAMRTAQPLSQLEHDQLESSLNILPVPSEPILLRDPTRRDLLSEVEPNENSRTSQAIALPGGQMLAPIKSSRKELQSRFRVWPKASDRRGSLIEKPKSVVPLVKGRYTFKEVQLPEYYDSFYGIQDIPTLLAPTQRFHPNTGTFSTDFFIRVDVRHALWVRPRQFAFENHSSVDPKDVQMYKEIDDYDNFYHPDKKERMFAPGLLSKKKWKPEPEYLSDVEFGDQPFEKKEMRIMRAEFPDLLHEPHKDGFANYTFGGVQRVAGDIYKSDTRPMEHIVIHGVDPEDFPGIEFADHNRRPNMLPDDENDNDNDNDEDDEEEYEDSSSADESVEAAEVVIPRAPQPRKVQPKPPRRAPFAEVSESILPTPQTEPRSRAAQSGQCYISEEVSRRLFFACIAVRVILNGFEGTIHWPTIANMFASHPNFDLPTFKARWNRMWYGHIETVNRVQAEFQDAFIEALEKEDVPPLDIQHGNKICYKKVKDWIKVVNWAVENVPVYPEELDLPESRSALSQALTFRTERNNDHERRERSEYIYTTQAKRGEFAHAAVFALPLRGRENGAISDTEVARSWIRASCATAEEQYDANAANAKLGTLNQGLLAEITKEMHNDKIIAHSFKLRNKAARNYHLSDQYKHIFNKRSIEAADFAEAVAFKSRLDEAFESSNPPRFILDQNITDGAAMAIMEMAASGHVMIKAVLPPIDSTIGAPWPRLTVWGFTEGRYKLRNMDRKSFTWDIEVVPSSMYMKGLPAMLKSQSIMPFKAPSSDPYDRARIPLWYDIHGNLIPKYWEGLVRSIVQHIAMKSGISIAYLTTPFNGLVWNWEIKLLVDWLVEVGVAQISESGAVMAKEWWWAVVPKLEPYVQAEKDGEAAGGREGSGQGKSGTPKAKKRRVAARKA